MGKNQDKRSRSHGWRYPHDISPEEKGLPSGEAAMFRVRRLVLVVCIRGKITTGPLRLIWRSRLRRGGVTEEIGYLELRLHLRGAPLTAFREEGITRGIQKVGTRREAGPVLVCRRRRRWASVQHEPDRRAAVSVGSLAREPLAGRLGPNAARGRRGEVQGELTLVWDRSKRGSLRGEAGGPLAGDGLGGR